MWLHPQNLLKWSPYELQLYIGEPALELFWHFLFTLLFFFSNRELILILQVYLGNPHVCSCTDFKKNHELCSHILWYIGRVRLAHVPCTCPVGIRHLTAHTCCTIVCIGSYWRSSEFPGLILWCGSWLLLRGRLTKSYTGTCTDSNLSNQIAAPSHMTMTSRHTLFHAAKLARMTSAQSAWRISWDPLPSPWSTASLAVGKIYT